MQNQMPFSSNESDNLIDQFIAALSNTAKTIYEAGRLLVRIVDTEPNGLERINEKMPKSRQISNHTFKRLLAIGREKIDERLAIEEWGRPGPAKLARCDISVQRKFLEEPIPVLIFEDGKTTHLLVSVYDLTKEQADQVFDSGCVRTLEQQRQWLQSRKPKPENVALKRPYSIKRGRIIFHEACELTLEQLSLLMAEAAGRL